MSARAKKVDCKKEIFQLVSLLVIITLIFRKLGSPGSKEKLSYDLHLPKKLSNDPFIFAVFRWEASIMCKNMDQEHHYICWIISI